jgi:hypothetical protein
MYLYLNLEGFKSSTQKVRHKNTTYQNIEKGTIEKNNHLLSSQVLIKVMLTVRRYNREAIA